MNERRTGRYLYGVIASGARPPLDGVAGVDPAVPVQLLDHAGVTALVHPVSLDEFGAEALKRNLEDFDWLERTARAHQAVLGRALAAGSVVPLRLCTIFGGEAQVRQQLEREREHLLETLERMRGRAEWSVKVFAERPVLEAAARSRSPALAALSADAEGGSPGRAYVARKKLGRLVQDEARALAETAAEEMHARLREQASAAALLPPQPPSLAPRAADMVLNGAYLVERGAEPRFGAVARELADHHRDLGLAVELAGPWPPFTFVAAAEGRR
jgi:Gas vesicle synthesis protein GvpL/GvpF